MSKGTDDIANDFYLPCLREATSYDRVAGYFTSAVYLLAWPGLRRFVDAGGRIRVICSPALSSVDVDNLELGYQARDDDALAEVLLQELTVMLEDLRLQRPARALAGLIASRIVDVRLAFLQPAAPAASKRIFHDKVGLFGDATGDTVGFRGTMNETYLGLAGDGNLESIDIFPSWVGGRDEERVEDARRRFAQLWANEMPYASVREFPSLVRAELERVASDQPWEIIADELAAEAHSVSPPAESLPATDLRPHQVRALSAWEAHKCRGILKHATGSGKTITALEAVRRKLATGEAPIVIVPSELLLDQWSEAIQERLGDLHPAVLLCGAGNDAWGRDGLLRAWLREPGPAARIVLAIVNTASQPEFLAAVSSSGRPILLVADEVHRLGSPVFRTVLGIGAQSRLGLSATPDRAGDPEGSARLTEYFEGVVDEYSLTSAIRDGYLTPYTYDPHLVSLSPDEQERWTQVTRRIRRRYGQVAGHDGAESAMSDDRLKMLLIERARIAKSATEKPHLAGEVLASEFERGQSWLVYCDSQAQLNIVSRELVARGLSPVEYHAAMRGDQQRTIREFEVNGGIMVAIRCLDEGVDIPSASHALILASSRNPREFIQRRGRVLRLHPSKTVSHIHDALVVPATAAGGHDEEFDALVWAELARAVAFSAGAINPEAQTNLERICIDLGLDIDGLAPLGLEEGEEADGA